MTGAEAYEKYADELMRFATTLVGPSDAADVVSEAIVRCIYGSRWEEVANHRAYLFRAVLREARSQYRSTLRRRVRESRAAYPERVSPPDPQPDVLAAVVRLSMRQRAVVYLTYWSDLDVPSVASLLGISDGAVKRHLARARRRLRELLDD